MSDFSFKSLFKRLANTNIPKVYVFTLCGFFTLVIIGMIVGNMYLNEMIFFEGMEKSVPFYTEEELREYGELYKELSMKFQNEIGAMSQDYANRTNRFGEKIHYGIYNHEHVEGNKDKIKKHSNGQNVNKSDPGHMSDYNDSNNNFSVDDTYIDSDEFNNGVKIKYAKTEGREDGESNFKDILSIVSILMDQKQGKDNEDTNYKEKIPNLIKNLFEMSHTYHGESSDLYPCEKGCRALFYYCNEIDNGYKNTGIDLQPFQIDPHDDFSDYSEEDFELIDPVDECIICGHNGKGCELDSGLCYHGEKDEESGCMHVMSSDTDCDKCHPHHICVDDGSGGDHDCSDNPIGCGGHYDCEGHPHYNYPGHFYVCCPGHTDLTVKIKIMYIDEMLDVIKNGYSATEMD